MNDYVRALRAELLKLRNTTVLRLTLVAPCLVVVLLFIWSLDARERFGASAWPNLAGIILGAWAMLLPLFLALVTALLADLENRHGGWKHLFVLPVPRGAIYAAKLSVAGLLVLLSLVLLTLLTAAAVHALREVFATVPPFPLRAWNRAVLGVFAASGLIIAVHTWISLRWRGFLVTLGFGFLLALLTALLQGEGGPWRYFPWLLAYNVVDDVARRAADVRWLWIGGLGGLAMGIAGAFDITRRDVD